MNQRIGKISGVMLQVLSSAAQDALIDLWELDLRPIGGEVHRLCNHVNELSGAVVWQGQAYQGYPIQAEGFELTGQGAGNRPKITVANVFGLITGAAADHGQLIGALVVRRQVLARFLDAANFAAGNPIADPMQEVVSKYLIERLASLTAETAVFELAAPSEADGSVIPARVMLADFCPFAYRGEECGYGGRPVADRFGMPTDDPTKDACGGRLLDCQARFGATAALPFGGFVGIDKTLGG